MKGRVIYLYYIYKIENIVNGKKYIGLTNNINRRRVRHFTDLKCGVHDNSFLQKEYDIYGKEKFLFEVVYSGDVDYSIISLKEKEYIEKYDSYYNGYNQNKGGNFGPSNGGTHLTKTDVFNILSAIEFMSRPGQILSNMFNVSKTTISRIKQGINHCEYYEEYHKMDIKDRREIYDIFCDSTNFYSEKVNTTILSTKRKFTKEQVYMIFVNEEFSPRLIPIDILTNILNVKSSNTIYDIINGGSYKDYHLSYKTISTDEKNKIVSLLREEQKKICLTAGKSH